MQISVYDGYAFLVREIHDLLKGRRDVTILDCTCGTEAVGKEVRIIPEELHEKDVEKFHKICKRCSFECDMGRYSTR